jgi:hypothetical protein
VTVERCQRDPVRCAVILRYQTADGRWVTVPGPRHTCRPDHKSQWRVEREPDGTPIRMWWIG